jgi:hypothetical protein
MSAVHTTSLESVRWQVLCKASWADSFRYARRALVSLALSIAVALLLPEPSGFRKSSSAPAQLTFQWDTTSGAVSFTPDHSCSSPGGAELHHFVGRVLLRLEEAEKEESNLHLRDDVRIAWVTCLYAERNEPKPHERATLAVLGVLPGEVWPRILANRKAKLGDEFSRWYEPDGSPLADKVPPAHAPEFPSLRKKAV